MNEVYLDGITYLKHGGCWLDDDGNEVTGWMVECLDDILRWRDVDDE